MPQSHVLGELWLGDLTIPSAVLWAVAPAETSAVVFVHGFGGSAVETWVEFDILAPLEQRLMGHDVFFYGYDGLRTHASESGDALFDFLDELLTDPSRIFRYALPPVMARPGGFRYSNVVIVAHSLGAVVTRFALLAAYNRDKENGWLTKVAPLFFAPAHAGTRGVDTVVSAATSFDFVGAKLLAALALNRYVAAADLREDSVVLRDLRDEIADIKQPERKLVQPKAVIWARRDAVVINKYFLDDPLPIKIDRTTHTEVCKPSAGFRDPIDILLQYI